MAILDDMQNRNWMLPFKLTNNKTYKLMKEKHNYYELDYFKLFKDQ